MRLTEEQARALQIASRNGGGGAAIPQSGKSRLQALGRLKAGTMNKAEASYERYLSLQLQAGLIAWYRFEGIKLRLADNTFLTVDFPVMRADGVLEMRDVKGAEAIVEEDAKVKMKVAAGLYPFIFKFVYPIPKKDGGGWREVEV